MSGKGKSAPIINWDGAEWVVRLPVEDDKVLEAKWAPRLTYVVRIREAGASKWSFGFETPLTHFSFVDLKADTDYEMEVRSKTSSGEGEPKLIRLHTNPTGHTDNIIQFPKR